MKILLWEVHLEPNCLAKIQWFLFKVFGIKQKQNPCGQHKTYKRLSLSSTI